MKNVLIIVTGFPPMNNISARRFGGMVQFMEEFGWRPSIVTLEGNGSLPVDIPESQIIRIGKVDQIGDSLGSGHLNTLSQPLSLLRTVASKFRFRLRSLDRTLLGWYKDVTSSVARVDELGQMDLVLASYGPSAAIWLGRFLAARYRIPWVADFRDLGAIMDDDRHPIARGIDVLVERYLLHNVAGITTVGEQLAIMLENEYRKPVKAVFNGYWFVDKTTKSANEDQSLQYPAHYIYYAGQLYDHRLPSLELFLRAMSTISNLELLIRSPGPVEMDKRILDMASILGLSDKVKIWPSCPPETVVREAQGSFCNLVVEDLNINNKWSRGNVTGKLMELLPLSPPVLAIARPDSEIGNVLRGTLKGELCSDLDKTNSFLQLANDKRFPGLSTEVEMFSKRSQCMQLCGFLDKLAAGQT